MKQSLLISMMLVALLVAGCRKQVGSEVPASASAAVSESQTESVNNDSLVQVTRQQDTIEVMSTKMGRTITNMVFVPEQYLKGGEERYPVLYLLHGADDNYAAWSNHVDLKQKATQYGMIIVCPDGQDSWYFDSPIDPKMQFETYVSKELVAYMDSHYRTIAKADKRAVTGLSMGGHGALWLAWRHPDVFKHCGSMSGGVDITKFPDRWNIDKRLGKYAAAKGVWATHSVASLVPTLKPGQNIIIDCGDRDFFFEVNMALHQALEAKGIAHDFTIRAGQHSWQYWVESLDKHLKFFQQALTGKPVKCTTSIVTRDKVAKTPETKKTETKTPEVKTPEVKKPEPKKDTPKPVEKKAETKQETPATTPQTEVSKAA